MSPKHLAHAIVLSLHMQNWQIEVSLETPAPQFGQFNASALTA